MSSFVLHIVWLESNSFFSSRANSFLSVRDSRCTFDKMIPRRERLSSSQLQVRRRTRKLSCYLPRIICILCVTGLVLLYGLEIHVFSSSIYDAGLPDFQVHPAAASIQSVAVDNQENNMSYSMFATPLADWSSSMPPPTKTTLKIYVYDNLPRKLTSDVEYCLLDLYINTIDHVENFKAELGLIYLFRTYPGRTTDPHEADFFVVPYAAEGHCQCHEGYTWNCAQVPSEDMEDLRKSLWFLNETSKKRHIFVLAGARAKPQVWGKPLKLTTAPSVKPGQIVVPNLEDKAPYQPSALLRRGEDWWTRRRKYAFSFVYGGRNAKMKGGGRLYREYLEQEIAENYPNAEILGIPFLMKRWSSPHDFHKIETFEIYNQSTLCPCLPGDLAWQKRFFDVILNGCIPVVLSFTTPNLPGGKSWFLPEEQRGEHASVWQTYPFAKGQFGGRESFEIDYESFVVEIPVDMKSQQNMSSVMTIMESILSDKQELRRRQRRMMQYAISFTYGMGKDAHRHNDAFAHIISALEHYQRAVLDVGY